MFRKILLSRITFTYSSLKFPQHSSLFKYHNLSFSKGFHQTLSQHFTRLFSDNQEFKQLIDKNILASKSLEEVLEHYQQLIKFQENQLEEGDLTSQKSLAHTYFEISNLLRENDKFVESQESIMKALEIGLKCTGEQDLDIAKYYLNLGICQSTQGEIEESVISMQKAIDIQINLLGENHNEVGKSYMELGNIYHAFDKPLEALENYEKCIEIFTEDSNGECKEELANVWDSLADLSIQNEGWEEAIEYFNEALEVRNEILARLEANKEEEHQSIAILYEKIAECYKEKGDFSRAKESYEKAIHEYNQVYDKESFEMVPFYQLFGHYAFLEGNYEESIEYYKTALRIYTSNTESEGLVEDFEVIEMYKEIANVAYQGGNYNESIEYDTKILEFYRRNKYMAKMEEFCERIAKAYVNLGNNEKAINIYRQVLVEFLDYFGKDDSGVKKFADALKDLYQMEEKYEEIKDIDELLEKSK